MHFAILDIEQQNDDNGSYVRYNISINGGHHSSLRYRQLREFHDQVKKEFGAERISVPFPPKKLLNLSQAQIDERRELLEKYLQAVSQDPEIVNSRTFIKFLLRSQKDYHNVEEEDVKLDLYLMNGKKFQVDVRSNGSTDHVMQEAMTQIKLPEQFVKYFALFLFKREDDGEIAVVRKLHGFESPYLVLLPCKDTHRLVVRKNFWNPQMEDELFKDTIALNLLYVQSVNDVEREWVITKPDVLKELNALKTQNARKKYLKLAKTQKFYNYIQFKPCMMDFPEEDSLALINIGGYELHFRLLGEQEQVVKVGSFKVSRVKCWRIVSSRDVKDSEVITKLSFEYLFAKDKLQWITITSDQAMLMSLCLQSMVDEIVKYKPQLPGGPQPTANKEEQPAKPVAERKQAKPAEESSNSNEGSRTEQNEESPEKSSTKKGKKKQKITSVKNEVFAQEIGDDDL